MSDKKLVNLHLEGDQTIPAEAWPTDVPGLIVTPGVTTHRVIEGKYTLTHEASGRRIGTALWDSVETVRLFADRIRDFTDWTQGPEDLKANLPEKASETVNSIGEKLQGEIDANPNMVLGVQ